MDGLQIYVTAYNDLQSECQIGMAKGQIPWYSIIKWAEFNGITYPSFVERLIKYIRAMEAVEYEHRDKKDNGRR